MSIQIINYEHSYAQKVADMWNKSGENWGGEERHRTAQDVIHENDNMCNLSTYIAVDEKEVVGYCSFGEYKEDEGASYIPLLNVRPDYHGKKLGKRLVLECVNKAIGEKWPRLDLYTWQGNEKAVPLYKKCGFFWEKRDDTTHLMNFIPYVMKTKAVKAYFDKLNWYKDNIREIKIESDGRVEGDYEYYDYVWEKESVKLKMEFERRGRGLTCIETEDYLIRVRVQALNLVYGRHYPVEYEIINKSNKPLNITIHGHDDKNIAYDLKFQGHITSRKVVEGSFYVHKTNEEQSIWKTHPCVSAVITINGLEALFKIGINPKCPIKLTLSNSEHPTWIGESSKAYLDIVNYDSQDVLIELKLLDADFITFDNPMVTRKLCPNEKASLPINYQLRNYGFYDKDIEVNIKGEHESSTFNTRVTGAFRGSTGIYYGADKENWSIYNGSYQLSLNKRNNHVSLEQLGCKGVYDFSIRPPKIGKPYSLEFLNKRPDHVNYEKEDACIKLKAIYSSESFRAIKLEYNLELNSCGLVSIYYTLKNTSDHMVHKDIYVNQRIFDILTNAYVPLSNQIIRSPGADGLMTCTWDYSNVDQNWIFCEDNETLGIGWPKEASVTFEQLFVVIAFHLGVLSPGDQVESKPIKIAYNTFKRWQDFCEYMGNKLQHNNNVIRQSFDCAINDGNPLIYNEIDMTFREYQKIPTDKSNILIQSENSCFESFHKSVDFQSNQAVVKLPCKKKAPLDIVNIKAKLAYRTIYSKKAVFYMGDKAVQIKNYRDSAKHVIEADNGMIKIKASPEYGIGIYSLEYQDYPWLDHSFPLPVVKGWWNYWTGGMGMVPEELTFASIQKEKRKAEQVDVYDCYGNQWSGIKTILEVEKHEKYKGLIIEHYFLMLPKIPILCSRAIVRQNTGHFLSLTSFDESMYVKGGDQLDKNWVKYKSDKGEEILYQCGALEFDVVTRQIMIHGVNDSKVKMIRLVHEQQPIILENTSGIASQQHSYNLSIPNQSVKEMNPSFIIFSEQDLDYKTLEDLTKLTFKGNSYE